MFSWKLIHDIEWGKKRLLSPSRRRSLPRGPSSCAPFFFMDDWQRLAISSQPATGTPWVSSDQEPRRLQTTGQHFSYHRVIIESRHRLILKCCKALGRDEGRTETWYRLWLQQEPIGLLFVWGHQIWLPLVRVAESRTQRETCNLLSSARHLSYYPVDIF